MSFESIRGSQLCTFAPPHSTSSPVWLSFFDAAQHAGPIARARSLPLYCSDEGFGYALEVDVVLEIIRSWGGVGCAEAMESRGNPSGACLSVVSTGVCRRERGTYVEEKGPVSRSMEGWEEDFTGLYMLLSLPLFS